VRESKRSAIERDIFVEVKIFRDNVLAKNFGEVLFGIKTPMLSLSMSEREAMNELTLSE
jgi:hypothetical protein